MSEHLESTSVAYIRDEFNFACPEWGVILILPRKQEGDADARIIEALTKASRTPNLNPRHQSHTLAPRPYSH